MHVAPRQIECPPITYACVPDDAIGSEAFVANAADIAQRLPTNIRDVLAHFHRHSHQSGALLLRGLSVGELPDTPPTPTTVTRKGSISELTLLAVAKCLGEPVGYKPELGGCLIQNLVPTQANQEKQISTSSKVPLMFHTEAAFHPHRPSYLVLMCLKGDAQAFTTLASIREVLPYLSESTRAMLFESRFRTSIDASYLNGRSNQLGAPRPVLSGDVCAPTMVFDEDLMVGMDAAAQAALDELAAAIKEHHIGVCLQQGDMLIVDNKVAVHGRSSYTPRFDGTDRWLQRTFVVDDLQPSAADREGRVITTIFGN